MNTLTEPKNWNDLANIQDADHFTNSDASCLDEIEQVLARHGMKERFGVALLHKHFDVTEDEVLVERCDAAKRTLTLQPEKIETLKGQDAVPTIYRFDGGVRYACTYCKKDHHS